MQVVTLGFIHCSRSISKCEDILSKHPNWVNRRDKGMKRLCLDYSSTNNWIQESLELENVDIKQSWSNGRVDAEVFCKDTKMFPAE